MMAITGGMLLTSLWTRLSGLNALHFINFTSFLLPCEGIILFSGESQKEVTQLAQMVHPVLLSLERWFRSGYYVFVADTNLIVRL